jgi:hypothetical protein
MPPDTPQHEPLAALDALPTAICRLIPLNRKENNRLDRNRAFPYSRKDDKYSRKACSYSRISFSDRRKPLSDSVTEDKYRVKPCSDSSKARSVSGKAC